MMNEEEVATQVISLISFWQQRLPEVQVVLGGSILSDLLVIEEEAQTIDVDVRFLTDNPTDTYLCQHIEEVTGLAYRKKIDVNDWPKGKSIGVMVEGVLPLLMLPYLLEIEGCIRNHRYIGWHQYFQSVLSQEELATIRAQKRALRHDRTQYKAMKLEVLNEVQRRCLALGLVSAVDEMKGE